MKAAASHLSFVLLGVEPVHALQLLRSGESVFPQPLGHVDVQDAERKEDQDLDASKAGTAQMFLSERNLCIVFETSLVSSDQSLTH